MVVHSILRCAHNAYPGRFAIFPCLPLSLPALSALIAFSFSFQPRAELDIGSCKEIMRSCSSFPFRSVHTYIPPSLRLFFFSFFLFLCFVRRRFDRCLTPCNFSFPRFSSPRFFFTLPSRRIISCLCISCTTKYPHTHLRAAARAE